MNYINTTTLALITESEIRSLNPNTSFPYPFIAPLEYALVFPAPQPEHDAITQIVRESTPALTSKGHYEQSWEVISRFTEYTDEDEVVHTVAEQEAKAIADAQATEVLRLETVEAARIASLWQSAHDYEYAQISGSAIGLLAMGVLQGLPKCISVQNWIKSIWTEYYTRKAGTSTDTDFSILGTCPHTVPELMVELGF